MYKVLIFFFTITILGIIVPGHANAERDEMLGSKSATGFFEHGSVRPVEKDNSVIGGGTADWKNGMQEFGGMLQQIGEEMSEDYEDFIEEQKRLKEDPEEDESESGGYEAF